MYCMYQNVGFSAIEFLGMGTWTFLGIIPLLLWSLAWKGWALWLAARRGEMIWFIVILAINTLGLLEIFYIFFIAKQDDTKDTLTVSPPVPNEEATQKIP